jgi:hypothetical protein
MDLHKLTQLVVPLARRTGALQAVCRGGTSFPIVPKRVREFKSEDPWETPYGRIEVDPEHEDGYPFTSMIYAEDRPAQWEPHQIYGVILLFIAFWIICLMQAFAPLNKGGPMAREEALRRRRLFREKQEWDILGEPDFAPTGTTMK